MTDNIANGGVSGNNLLAKPANQLTPDDMRALCGFHQLEFNTWVYGYAEIGRCLQMCLLMPSSVRHAYGLGAAGLAKSHMMKTSGKLVTGLEFKRVQCHSELTPTMIVGGPQFDQSTRKTIIVPGEIVGKHLVLADELPRATPNAQGGFLEAMAEGQVTLPGQAPIQMADPFVILATANPAEQKGVYPLPEAQWDRFLFQLAVPYTEEKYAKQMLLNRSLADGSCYDQMKPQMTREQLIAIRDYIADNVHVSAAFVDYLYEIVDCTRPGQKYFEKLVGEHGKELLVPSTQAKAAGARGKDQKPGTVADVMSVIMRGVNWGGGAGPRAEQCLLMAAKIQAFLYGKTANGEPRHGHVDPADLDEILNAVLRHRIILTPEAKWPEFQEQPVTTDQVINVIKGYVKPLHNPQAYEKGR